MNYKSKLVHVEVMINTKYYIRSIEHLGCIDELDAKKGKNRWIFHQDGASSYIWLRHPCRIIDDWLAKSPDLFPIERRWAIMRRIVSKSNTNTTHGLKKVLQAAWDFIPTAIIKGF
jgi:hypothetical protein